MLIRLPSPKCVVFYNGTNDIPEQNILCLSDSYGYKIENSPDTYPDTYLNLKVLVSNLNGCYNEDIKRNCRTLADHQTYVSLIMEYAEKLSIGEAVEKAAGNSHHVIRYVYLMKTTLTNLN